MPEPTQADYQAAYDINVGGAATVKAVAQTIAAAREEGIRMGTATDTRLTSCVSAERARVVGEIRTWAKDAQHWRRNRMIDSDDLLAKLDEIEKEGTQP